MVLNVALSAMLLLSVGALLACHRSGWLMDFILRPPRNYARSYGSPPDRATALAHKGAAGSDAPSESTLS
jgi:hypothetical protein